MGLIIGPQNSGVSLAGYSPVDPLSGMFPIGAPAMAPMGTSASPSLQAATQAAVDTSPTVGNITPPTTTGGPIAPQFNPITGENLNPSLLQKGGLLDVGLGALQTLGNLWNSFQQVKLAKDTFSFQKQAYATNLANQESTYNTTLANRENSRGSFEGRSQVDTDAYIKAHSL